MPRGEALLEWLPIGLTLSVGLGLTIALRGAGMPAWGAEVAVPALLLLVVNAFRAGVMLGLAGRDASDPFKDLS